MAAVRCYEHRPPQSGFGDDFDAVGGDNSFNFARNCWLVAGRRGFACRELALLNEFAVIKSPLRKNRNRNEKEKSCSSRVVKGRRSHVENNGKIQSWLK
jgi:hypothetical protein